MLPLILAFLGCSISIGILILRRKHFPNQESVPLKGKYEAFLIVSIIGGTFPAGWAFYELVSSCPTPVSASGSNTTTVDYAQILTILGLLAAAVIAGFFAFTFQDAASDEGTLTTAISCCFAALFYIILTALSFYAGKSPHVCNAEYASLFLPFIMWVLLVANSLYNFWDYRTGS